MRLPGSAAALAVLLGTAPALAQFAPGPPAALPVEATAPTPPAPETAPRARQAHARGDPLEGFNRGLFKFHQKLDKAVFRPVALGYKSIIPKFVRTGIRHFLSNLTEPIVFLNDLLQLKPKRAVKTLGRFFINSTAGIGGVLDIAKTARLPHRNNGFGNTLARYGVGPGPYLFLPFVGPTDLRDFLGGQGDVLVLPFAVGRPFNRLELQIPLGVVGGLDLRAENDAGLKALLNGAADPYATLRSVYQQSRTAEIDEIKGKATTAGLDDPLLDPDAGGAPPPPEPAPEIAAEAHAASSPNALAETVDEPALPANDDQPDSTDKNAPPKQNSFVSL
ncbi:MAG: VacJ family lipoprotein [Sphingomonas sp.]